MIIRELSTYSALTFRSNPKLAGDLNHHHALSCQRLKNIKKQEKRKGFCVNFSYLFIVKFRRKLTFLAKGEIKRNMNKLLIVFKTPLTHYRKQYIN